jgi:hypothetical protein
VLAGGHVLDPTLGARRRAEQLSDDAAALHAQAEHQTKRARRNTSERLRAGQAVCVDGREATFLYLCDDRAAAVRFAGEQSARVVPVARIAASLNRR